MNNNPISTLLILLTALVATMAFVFIMLLAFGAVLVV
jgi:hypothetical protein